MKRQKSFFWEVIRKYHQFLLSAELIHRVVKVKRLDILTHLADWTHLPLSMDRSVSILRDVFFVVFFLFSFPAFKCKQCRP